MKASWDSATIRGKKLWPKKTPRQPANDKAPAKRCCNQRPNNIVLLGFGGCRNGLEESSFKADKCTFFIASLRLRIWSGALCMVRSTLQD